MVNFRSIELNRLVSMKSGEAITAQHIDDYGEYPCFGGNGLRGYTNQYTHQGEYALIGRQGALCGNVTYVNGTFYASEHAVVVAPKEDNIIKYIYYVLEAMHLNQYVESSAQPGLSVNKLLNLLAYVSTDSNEQQRIATVLADIDAMISSLKTLIAKKKAIKLSAMQELLTGKKRLPGFSGEWINFNLMKHSKIKARIGWQGLKKSEYLDSGYALLITGTDFDDGKVEWDSCHYVTRSRYEQDRNIQIQDNDILITKDGSLGKAALVQGLTKPATLNSGIFVIRPMQNAYDPVFVYHILSSFVFKDFLDKLSAGSTIIHLYQKDVGKFEFGLPPTIEEQEAIAALLSEMDSEIEALQQKLEKYRQLKQGMMQQLLTGKIRLK